MTGMTPESTVLSESQFDSTDMKCPDKANLWRQKADQRLSEAPGTGGKRGVITGMGFLLG